MSYYVYAIGHDRGRKLGGPVKIGITGNPDGRISSIRTGSPHRVDFAFVLDVLGKEPARVLEQAAHEHFKEKALQGEWFDITPTEAGDFLTDTLEKFLFTGFAQESWPMEELKSELWRSGVVSVRRQIAASRYIDAWEHQ